MRVLAFLFGLILLLPGACALGFMSFLIPEAFAHPPNSSDVAQMAMLWAVCLLISFGGVVLIRNALRGQAPRRDPPTGG